MSIIHTYDKLIPEQEICGNYNDHCETHKRLPGKKRMINQLISGVLQSCPEVPVPALWTL